MGLTHLMEDQVQEVFLALAFLAVAFLATVFLVVDFAMGRFQWLGEAYRRTGCWPCHVFFRITTIARRCPDKGDR